MDYLQNLDFIIAGIAILIGSFLLMFILGLIFTMPRKFKNFVRAYGDEEEFVKRMKLASLWMNIFYAAYYPIMLLLLIPIGIYIFGFGVLYSDEAVERSLYLQLFILSADWVVWELLFNIS